MNWGLKPFVRLLPPLVLGILFAIMAPLPFSLFFPALISVFFLVGLVLFSSLFSQYRHRFWFGIILNLSLVLCGYQLTLNMEESANLGSATANGQVLVAEIAKEPQAKTKKITLEVRISAVKTTEGWESTQGNVLLSVPLDERSTQLQKGDYIAFAPQLKEVKSTANPGQFDYAKYLRFHLIKGQGFLRSHNWTLVEKAKSGFWKWADEIRNYGIAKIQNALKPREAAVAEALIFGYKSHLDTETREAFSASGAMHVLAVSGLHVGILFLICGYLFGFINKTKYAWISSVFTLLIIWCYALITGLSPSVMRAATMFSFMTIGKSLNRHTNIYNSIAGSAFLLLLINPYLLTEVGFQLSYFAVTGIVWLQPKINAWFHSKWKVINTLWEWSSVSLAAQTATFPLGMYYFNMFPNYFLLSNIVVIPAAFVILISGLAFVGLAEAPLIGKWLGLLLQGEVWLLNESVTFIQNMPYSVSSWVITAFETILIYLIIIQLVKWLIRPKSKKLIGTLAVLLVLCSSFSWRRISADHRREFIVYNLPYQTAFNFIDSRDHVLVSSLHPKEDEKTIRFNIKPHWLKSGLIGEKYISTSKLKKESSLFNLFRSDNPNLYIRRNYFQFYSLRVAYVNRETSIFPSSVPNEVDVLIVSGHLKISPEELFVCFRTKEIITDGACSPNYEEALRALAEQSGIAFHATRESGARMIEVK